MMLRRLFGMSCFAAGPAIVVACGSSGGGAADGGLDSAEVADASLDGSTGSDGSVDAVPDMAAQDASAADGARDARAEAPSEAGEGSDTGRGVESDAPSEASSAAEGGADAGSSPDGSCATAVDNGAEYTCAVRSDSTLWCWGDNGYGQLGDGTMTYRYLPEPITALPSVATVATGTDSACALTTGGAVWCWGRNDFGEVGDGTTVPRPTPQVTLSSGVKSLAVGYTQHQCVIESDGSVWCWGSDTSGESGGGRVGMVLQPNKVAGLPSAALAVSVGDLDTCVITSDTALWCWGDNLDGQLGYATPSLPWSVTPQQVTALGTGVVKVAVGFEFTCALKNDGSLWCWGSNMYDALGPEIDGGTGTPTLVAVAGSTVSDVATSENTCIRKADGTVWCWGLNEEYQCGFAGITTGVPTQVVGVSHATQMAVGGTNSCAIANGGVLCWGTNGAGELGIGVDYPSWTATPTSAQLPCP
jgi:alpha-tubulin suppressor-like RCC1 family protein